MSSYRPSVSGVHEGPLTVDSSVEPVIAAPINTTARNQPPHPHDSHPVDLLTNRHRHTRRRSDFYIRAGERYGYPNRYVIKVRGLRSYTLVFSFLLCF